MKKVTFPSIFSSNESVVSPRFPALLALFLMCVFTNSFAQGEKDNWFFGNLCSLNFNSPTPASGTGSLNTGEGSATISDALGRLLFYTDGITVWNKSGGPMPNGTGLLGHISSTQSALIVPMPCSKTKYYVFSVDFVSGTNGINYSIVNMDDNSDGFYNPLTELGFVDPILKNIPVPNAGSAPTGERICALMKANGLDYWVIATEAGTNNFYTYSITPTGITLASVTNIGPILGAGYYMKASPDGSKLAVSNIVSVVLYDFNNATGTISNPYTIPPNPNEAYYGVEFSPDSKQLYYDHIGGFSSGITGIIYQVNLTVASPSPVNIGFIPAVPFGSYPCGALQLSPNNQMILIAKPGAASLAAIVDPNVGGTGNFVLSMVNLAAGSSSNLGLPNFISGKVNPCMPLSVNPPINAVSAVFTATDKADIVSGGISNLDKEFGDIDNDGDIDILYSTGNNKTLTVKENTAGYGNNPVFGAPVPVVGVGNGCNSFRLYDWDKDGDNDLIIHRETSPKHRRNTALF